MPKLLIASENPGKIVEFRALLKVLKLELVDPGMLDLHVEVIEQPDSYLENAKSKASTYAETSGLWTIADDSGLEVDALDGAPGALSARLAGPGRSDGDRRIFLLDLLKQHPKPWTARFKCTIALTHPKGPMDIARGICEGRIIPTERGEHGFGYDPIFLVAGTDYTMAELPMEEKNRLSHRAKAVKELIPVIKERFGV
jgi:XTP/dITP diphosphohydrolase